MDFKVDLDGRIAVVTGAAGAIGRAVALLLARSGATVVISDSYQNAAALSSLAGEIDGLAGRVLAATADVSSRGDIDELLGDILNEFGSVDILVNAAGVYIAGAIAAFAEQDWDNSMELNLKTAFLTCQVFSKVMCEQGQGCIINIASDSAIGVVAGEGPYACSQSALITFTRHLASELGPHNVRANAIAPGWVKTEDTQIIWSDIARRKEAEASIPLGFMAEPGDIASVVLFLATRASRYITGQVIVANGGKL